MPYLKKLRPAVAAIPHVMRIDGCDRLVAIKQIEDWARENSDVWVHGGDWTFSWNAEIRWKRLLEQWPESPSGTSPTTEAASRVPLVTAPPNSLDESAPPAQGPAVTSSTAEPAPAEDAQDAAAHEAPIYHTGTEGKPTSWFLIEWECRRRYNAGERHVLKGDVESPSEWARTLLTWLRATHPSAPHMGSKAATNRLSRLLRELQANTPDR